MKKKKIVKEIVLDKDLQTVLNKEIKRIDKLSFIQLYNYDNDDDAPEINFNNPPDSGSSFKELKFSYKSHFKSYNELLDYFLTKINTIPKTAFEHGVYFGLYDEANLGLYYAVESTIPKMKKEAIKWFKYDLEETQKHRNIMKKQSTICNHKCNCSVHETKE